jgi:hypothetical protein
MTWRPKACKAVSANAEDWAARGGIAGAEWRGVHFHVCAGGGVALAALAGRKTQLQT